MQDGPPDAARNDPDGDQMPPPRARRPPPPKPQVAEPARPRRRWLRALGFAIFIVIGTSAAVAGATGATGAYYYGGAGGIVYSLTVGAVIAFLFLLAVGSVGYGISRARGRGKSWSQVTFGGAAMITTLVLLVVSAGAGVARHEEAVSQAKPDPSGTLIQRERAYRDVAAFASSFRAFARETQAAVTAQRALLTSLEKEGNTPKTRALAERTRGHIVRMLAVARAVPDFPDQDLNALRNNMVQSSQLKLSGYDLYLTALRRNSRSSVPLSNDKESLALFGEADALVTRSHRLVLRGRAMLVALNAKYGVP